MEHRKNNKSNLENKKTVFLLMGVLFILSCTYAALSLKSYSNSAYEFEMQVEDDLSELPPITTPPPPPPPPPPPAAKPPVEPEIKLVEDEVITEEPDFDDTELEDVVIEDAPVGEDTEEEIEDVPQIYASNMPCFPECASLKSNMERDKCTKAKLNNYLLSNFETPDIAREMGYSGTVYVKFIVNRQGAVTGVQLLKGVQDLLDKEAIRVVKSLPKFIPGTNMDKPVSVIYNVPIRIVLE